MRPGKAAGTFIFIKSVTKELFPIDMLILVLSGLIVPPILTILNLWSIATSKPVKKIKWDVPAILLGFFYTVGVFWLADFDDYDVAINRFYMDLPYHTPLASWHLPTLLVLFGISVLGYALLRYGKALPPLVGAFCLSAVLIGCVLAAVYAVQIGGNVSSEPLLHIVLLYPINCILLYLRMIHAQATEMAAHLREQQIAYENPLLQHCHQILTETAGWILAGALLAFPLLFLTTLILMLFGQAPDAAIRVFTDTSEWALSTKISPPDLIYDEHYLCTVAAQGTPKLVKPLRMGVRHHKPIVVNRQLCVANAFEQLLMEHVPRFHQAVRGAYDRYGYPISRHITTVRRANLVYLLMKPLEWCFLLVLYLFTAKPENRIAMQYTAQ